LKIFYISDKLKLFKSNESSYFIEKNKLILIFPYFVGIIAISLTSIYYFNIFLGISIFIILLVIFLLIVKVSLVKKYGKRRVL